MTDEEEGPVDGLLEEWQHHPITKNVLSAFIMKRESALKAVLAAAGSTTDPHVARALGLYYQIDSVVNDLKGEKKNA